MDMEAWNSKTRQPNGLINKFVSPGDVVFDIGAHVGSKTDIYLSRGAQVVCFEPQIQCLRVLYEKYRDNQNVRIVNKGLADKTGQMQLSICDSANVLSTFSEEWKTGRFADYSWDRVITVEVTTLDEMIGIYGHPKYCKIDVEGFEFEVLKGLSQPVPYLSFEFTIEFLENAKKCLCYLQSLGYRHFNLALEETPKFVFSEWISPETLIHHIERLGHKQLWGNIYAKENEFQQKQTSMKNYDLNKRISVTSIAETVKTKPLDIGRFSEKVKQEHLTDGELGLIEKFIAPGDVAFDIGANVGTWTKKVLNRHSNIQVHLFEPAPESYQKLLQNLAEPIGSGQVIANNCAASEKKGNRAFYYYRDKPSWSTFHRRLEVEKQFNLESPESLPVSTVTLDSYCEKMNVRHIHFLKIDTEGGEFEVLKGAEELLHKGRIDYLQFEYGGTFLDAGITLQDIFQYLQNMRYELFKLSSGWLKHIEQFSSDYEDYEYSNFFAVNERFKSKILGQPPTMLNLLDLCSQYNIVPRGIIHVGAYEGKEIKTYKEMAAQKVLFIEANPAVYKRLVANISTLPNVDAVNCAVSNYDGTTTLHVTSMDQSSSILPLKRHREIYPDIKEVHQITVKCRTLDSLLKELGMNTYDFNIINIDIQGAELMAFQGSTDTLKYIDAINTEVNYEELYEGCALVDQIDDFLKGYGFERKATTSPYHPSWGDGFYVKTQANTRRPVITMSTLGKNGRFANQVFQYAFLKIYAKQHNLEVRTPPWIGQDLFGHKDPPILRKLPLVKETTSELAEAVVANAQETFENVDFWGYFQYNTRYYAPHKDFFRSLFRPVPEIEDQMNQAINSLHSKGKTIVGLHLRRSDYGYGYFFVTPSEWYKRWLQDLWPRLDEPVLFIASDEPEKVVGDFAEYNPVTTKDLDIDLPAVPFYPDFYILSKCDIVAISNSSFSFLACMLNESGKLFYRPRLSVETLIPFEPWDSEPILRDEKVLTDKTQIQDDRDKNQANALNQQGEALLDIGDIEGAINAFTKAIEIHSDFAVPYNNLGVLFWQKGQIENAVKHFVKALEIDPLNRNTIWNCAEVFKSLQRFEDARQIYSSYLKRNPDDKEIASALLQLQPEHKAPQEIYRQTEEISPDAQRPSAEAAACPSKSAQAKALNQQGEYLFFKGDIEGALNAFTKAIEVNSDLAAPYNNLGVLFWQKGQIENAVKHFVKALEIDPLNRNTIWNCAEVFKSLQRFEDARQIYSSYLKRNPDDKEIASALLQLQPEHKAPQEICRQTEKNRPDTQHPSAEATDCPSKSTQAKALNQQGEYLFVINDLEGALNAFTRAIEIDSDFALPHNNLGVLFWKKDQIKNSVKHFIKALEIDPNDRDTISNCTEAFKSLQRSNYAGSEANALSQQLKIASEHKADDRMIPPEIKNDEFYYTIQELARTRNIKTILEIGSSAGDGSTEAFVTGLRDNPNRPMLYCIEAFKPRFAVLKRRYADNPQVKCYQTSTVSIDNLPTEQEVVEFYNKTKTNLNRYPLEQVLGWLRCDKECVKNMGTNVDGVTLIKKENNIKNFDMVLIDGSAFTGFAELETVYGAKLILLDDINDIKNYKSYKRLLSDPNYKLVKENWNLRNGYAVFERNDNTIPIHFFTIVLNGQPFIRHHIEVFNQLPFKWHWHIIEGVAELKHDTAWSVKLGGRINEQLHRNGLSNDGTAEYIDEIAKQFPDNVTIYRKVKGVFWEGKLEMVNAPLANINEQCLLWEVDSDELWTLSQIEQMRSLFLQNPYKTSAYFHCYYFVGPRKYVSSLNTWATYPNDWIRVWRFSPSMKWTAHEPPTLVNTKGQNVGLINPFTRDETKSKKIIFQHFAYVTEPQVRFKEIYYGYKDAVAHWKRLQETHGPVRPADYLPWAKSDAIVDDWKQSDGALLSERLPNSQIGPTNYSSMSVDAKVAQKGCWKETFEASGKVTKRVKVAEDYIRAGTKVDPESSFGTRIQKLFTKIRPRKIIETGTYLGTGTTIIIAKSLQRLGIDDAMFFTIEVNPQNHARAKQYFEMNNMKVNALNGLSVPRAMLPSREEIAQKTITDVDYDGIFVDHKEENRVELYYNETNFPNLSDDLLYKCLKVFDFKPDFVLLDSGGHMGNIEFKRLIDNLQGECYIALDDIYHVKHHRSFRQIQEDERLELIVHSKEKFGFCIAKFTPICGQLGADKHLPMSSEPQPTLPSKASNSYKNILWIRPDSIGDNVLAASMLPHIRKKYKNAKITIVCQEHIAKLYEACPYADNIIALNKGRFLQNEQYFEEILNSLRTLKADLSLHSVYSRELAGDLLAIMCDAKQRVGLEGDTYNILAKHKNKLDQLYTRLLPSKGKHKLELDRHRDFLRGLSIDVPSLKPMIWTTDKDEKFAEKFFEESNFKPEHTIALFAGAQQQIKSYDKYGRALSEFCKENHLNVVALGAENDRNINQRNLSSIGVKTVNLSGKTTICQSAEILRRCRLAFGADTGLAHISCAVAVPNVILLGGAHFGRFMPYSPLTSIVCLPLKCYGCNWGCRYLYSHCVKGIKHEVVAEALRQTFAKPSEKIRVFVQSESLWEPNPWQPAWCSFEGHLDIDTLEIIPVPPEPSRRSDGLAHIAHLLSEELRPDEQHLSADTAAFSSKSTQVTTNPLGET